MSKWRNPYLSINKRNERRENAAVKAPPALLPHNNAPTADVRTSITRMRTNIKGISSTIRQMQETMDKLYGAMELFDSFHRSQARSKPLDPGKPTKQKLYVEEDNETESSSSLPQSLAEGLGQIDIGQLLNLLKSPLVQSLLSQAGSSPSVKSKRKKEG